MCTRILQKRNSNCSCRLKVQVFCWITLKLSTFVLKEDNFLLPLGLGMILHVKLSSPSGKSNKPGRELSSGHLEMPTLKVGPHR